MIKMNRRAMLMSSAAAAISTNAMVCAKAQTTSYTPNDLKSALTPLGAERAGNDDGSIPAWTGGYSTLPAGYQPGDPRPIPFADEKPLFSVTAANLSQHQDRLAAGAIELFSRYPAYRIDVYPTHRTAIAPQYVYDNTYKNASTGQISADGNSIDNVFGGTPFPIPKNGHEVIWNHLLAWKGTTIHSSQANYTVTSSGNMVLDSLVDSYFQFPYYMPEREAGFDGFYYEFTARITAPPYQSGGANLALYPINPIKTPQRFWEYMLGQRRTRKAPDLEYDTPNYFTSGIGDFDEVGVFLGALNEYDFKLVGKKELYVPYNSNMAWAVPPEEQMRANFINPDHLRWELHRVWVVEMTLLPGARNIDARRVIYCDEDTWNGLMCDVYDSSGKSWKFIMGIAVILPDIPCLLGGSMQTVYDFHAGDYVTEFGVNSQSQAAWRPIAEIPASYFTSGQLAALAGGE